jgi:transposase
MISISPQSRILVQIESLDFRKGMDSIVGLCGEVHGKDPFSGTYFLFRNKKRTALRILFFDGQGTWLCQKRFSKGRLRCWPKTDATGEALSQLVAREVYTLIWNGDPKGARFGPEWKPLPLIKSE